MTKTFQEKRNAMEAVKKATLAEAKENLRKAFIANKVAKVRLDDDGTLFDGHIDCLLENIRLTAVEEEMKF